VTNQTHQPPDQAARAAIIGERECNVVVVAGAGTGKTKTIIDRAVDLLAPAQTGVAAVPIQRMAAITFTRRAAGELRFRIREQLLRELEGEARRAGHRADRLREALGNLDAAFIGTIHGFADRLLRLRPVEAALSPAYALIEDNAELVSETFLRLRRAAEAGTVPAALGRFGAHLSDALTGEAADTLRAAVRAGLQMARAETAYGPVASVEATLARMIDTRDVDVVLSPIPDPGLDAARAAAERAAEMIGKMRGADFGHRQLQRMVRTLRRLREVDDPAEAFRIVQEAQRGRQLYKGRDFNDDSFAWSIYSAIRPDSVKLDSLAQKLKGPHRWLATRLVRLFPVVCAMYERVKAEHEVVDYLDLLIKLRDLLRDHHDARRFYQGLFDHIFVDEFQDTDPLQCEIVFFLSEDGVHSDDWTRVRLAPGKLTIVGDPQQSIYRFRRADIMMYGQAAERLAANGALEQRLETNFRSRPELITFFNQQLARVLGKDDGPAFDPHSGRANYDDLVPAATTRSAGISVHVLPYADAADEGLLAGDGRGVEAAMVARYVRWLLQSQRLVRDPDTDEERPIQPGDIAVLACVTTNLRLLLRQLDTLGIEYSARGGALFLAHPVVRQYLLALRGLADRDDGVAEAALLRPPFFGIDCADAVAGVVNKNDEDPRRARVRAARDIVATLRARRHAQSPGATARDLIEHTGLGRAVITGHNGRQTLAALYELATEVDRRAAVDGLDFDAVTELFRSWAEVPVFLDAPEPIGASAVHVMTIHGAKGLEFPVVILWDGFQTLSDRGGGTWRVERDGQAWALSLGPVAVEHPPSGHLLDREKQLGEQERRRMYYVAATRARDLLALPVPLTKGRMEYANSALAGGLGDELAHRFETYRAGSPPEWAQAAATSGPQALTADAMMQAHLDAVRSRFAEAVERATQPLAVPTAVTLEARSGANDEISLDAERTRKAGTGRLGVGFGSTVHRALELVVSGAIRIVPEAVSLAAQETGLTDHLTDAAADVQRALDTLRCMRITDNAAMRIGTEYPLAVRWRDGKLLSGVIDLLAENADVAYVIDFKTDTPLPGTLAAAYPRYAAQLQLYGEMLRVAGVIGTRRLRLGLLLTASGEFREL
jgi:ATP-dependent exoDNAse (exonuclease V) beta subunit